MVDGSGRDRTLDGQRGFRPRDHARRQHRCAARRGEAVNAGAVIETGPGARAVIVRDMDFVTIAPNSRIRVPVPQAAEAGLIDIIEEWGNAIFQIEKQPNPHFRVGTPYLAAVVKGTTFSITVSEQGASLQVTEGIVDTSTPDGGAHDLITAGIVASVSAADPHRLVVQGQQSRIIDSPGRPARQPMSFVPEGPCHGSRIERAAAGRRRRGRQQRGPAVRAVVGA
jgi:hypothetical protein